MSLGFEDCKVFVSTVDSQSSAESGIVVQVVGELSNQGGPWRKFAQTFFLAEQPNGYFVLNDIFRYIKEEIDEEEAEQQQQQEQPTTIATAASAIISMITPSALTSAPNHSNTVEPQHDLELKDAHGPSSTAAGVTIAPPSDGQTEANVSLENTANGVEKQQQVVDLHDEIESGIQPRQEDETAKEEPVLAPRINGIHVSEEAPQRTANSPLASQEGDKVRSSEFTAVAAESSVPIEANTPITSQDSSSINEKKPKQTTSAASTSRVTASASSGPVQPAPPNGSSATVSVPAAPAPKTWANLAASGQNKWKTQVMSNTQGVSSSATTSGASPPATITGKGPADPASEKGEDAISASGSGRPARNTGAEGTSDRLANVDNDWSFIVKNVAENVLPNTLRKKLSDKFAQGNGPDRKWAKMSYPDIDRSRGFAFIHFDEEWPLAKEADGTTIEIDGIVMTIEKGRGDRREGSGYGSRGGGNSQNANSGSGKGGRSGSNAGGQGGARGGSGGGANSGRNQGREGQTVGQRKTQGAARGGAGATRT